MRCPHCQSRLVLPQQGVAPWMVWNRCGTCGHTWEQDKG